MSQFVAGRRYSGRGGWNLFLGPRRHFCVYVPLLLRNRGYAGRSRSIVQVIALIRCTMRLGVARNKIMWRLAVLAWLISSGVARAQALTIAAASDLQAVLPTLCQNFE